MLVCLAGHAVRKQECLRHKLCVTWGEHFCLPCWARGPQTGMFTPQALRDVGRTFLFASLGSANATSKSQGHLKLSGRFFPGEVSIEFEEKPISHGRTGCCCGQRN